MYDGRLLKCENFTSEIGFVELQTSDLGNQNFQSMKGYKLGNPVVLNSFQDNRAFPLIFESGTASKFSGKLGFFNLEFIKYVNKKLIPPNTDQNLSIVSLIQSVEPVTFFSGTRSYLVIIGSNYCIMVPMVDHTELHVLNSYFPLELVVYCFVWNILYSRNSKS